MDHNKYINDKFSLLSPSSPLGTHRHLWHLQDGRVVGNILISLRPGIPGVGLTRNTSLTKATLWETSEHLTPLLLTVECLLDLRQ